MVSRTIRCKYIVGQDNKKKLDEALAEGSRLFTLAQQNSNILDIDSFFTYNIKRNIASFADRAKKIKLPNFYFILDFNNDCEAIIRERERGNKEELIFVKINFSLDEDKNVIGFVSTSTDEIEFLFDALEGDLSFGKAQIYKKNDAYYIDVVVNKRAKVVNNPRYAIGIEIEDYKIFYDVLDIKESTIIDTKFLSFDKLKESRERLLSLSFGDITEEILEKKDRETALYIEAVAERFAKILSMYNDAIAFIEDPKDRKMEDKGNNDEQSMPYWIISLMSKVLERRIEWYEVPLIVVPSTSSLFECPFGDLVWENYKKILDDASIKFKEYLDSKRFKIIVIGMITLLYMPDEQIGEINPFILIQ
ncbi:MAG TPA: hypothetical protein HA341_01545 [Halobacteria archaeon]|jgi:hypothetical protein|nr:hypothetical protein [Halobacteria archaeon]